MAFGLVLDVFRELFAFAYDFLKLGLVLRISKLNNRTIGNTDDNQRVIECLFAHFLSHLSEAHTCILGRHRGDIGYFACLMFENFFLDLID